MSPAPRHILLVDDDDINNFLSTEILSHYSPGSKIVSKSSVKSGLDYLVQLVAQNEALPDTILVDINIPWQDGWNFIENFERLELKGSERIKLYIYTSSVYYKDIDKGKTYRSVVDIFSKPLTEEMLALIFSADQQPK